MGNTLFMVAGEPSGDRIGADFLKRLRQLRSIHAIGVGGPKLQAAGLTSIFPMENLSVMGFVDVALRLPLLLYRVEETVRAILCARPELVVLIDSQVFSALVAKKLRKRGYRLPIILYVAPAVWAWKPERAPKLNALYNEIWAVLPFEPAAMLQLGGPETFYVGHPATQDLIDTNTTSQKKISNEVALLPGSRGGELRRHLPVFRQVAERLATHDCAGRFVLPTLPKLKDRLEREVARWNVNVDVLCTEPERSERIRNSAAALATAGTITLELALMKVPHIGTYIPDRWQMKAFEKADRPMISLANNLLGAKLVPEIFPGDDHVGRLEVGILEILTNPTKRQLQLDGFIEIERRMVHGDAATGKVDALDRMLKYFPAT